MITLIIDSFNQFSEHEWSQVFTAHTLKGAQIKAGKWIKHQGFDAIVTKTRCNEFDNTIFYRNLLARKH